MTSPSVRLADPSAVPEIAVAATLRPLPAASARALLRRGLLLSGLLLLAGCGVFSSSDKTATPEGCPKVAFLPDAEQVTQFRPGTGRDLTDVVSRAVMADYVGSCDYHDKAVDVQVKLTIQAERGPALKATQGTYDYFVAVTDENGTILAKQPFQTTVDFAPNSGRGGSVETLSQEIPLRDLQRGPHFQVLIGFQLNDAELAYNRSQKKF